MNDSQFNTPMVESRPTADILIMWWAR